MKKIVFFLYLFFTAGFANPQNLDSLKNLLSGSKDDLLRLNYLNQLSLDYVTINPDSSRIYVQQAIVLANKLESDSLLSQAYYNYGWYLIITGNYPQALHVCHESLRSAERSGSFFRTAAAYDLMAQIYTDEGDYVHALGVEKIADSILRSHLNLSQQSLKTQNPTWIRWYVGIQNLFAFIYELSNQLDISLKYNQRANDVYIKAFGELDWANIPYEYGRIYSKMGNYPKALHYYYMGVGISARTNNKKDLMDNYNGLADVYKSIKQYDSSILFANKVLETGKSAVYFKAQSDAYILLSGIYKSKHNVDSLAKYLELTIAAKDSLFGQQKILQLQSIAFDEALRQEEIKDEQMKFKNRAKIYALVAGLGVVLLLAWIQYRNNQKRQKANIKLEKAYNELKDTQAQLVQREKMASLGELTAGIAHEIQNPLNFVNNFSDVNDELIDEAGQEIEKGNIREVKTLLNNIKDNGQKINHHGKRADAIVKAMLQHSQSSTGKKELTDINKLADEYLRLSYHGLRAKDKSFNANFETDFDPSIEKINVVPQDIGRVLLNLINNAFYAVNEKQKQNLNGYEPTVTVATAKRDGKVEIKVKDNGNGIPQKVLDKIFQPFFTTKPTGQGTGLGLSLAYDIVKAHGGEIKVDTKEGKGSEFIIQLPLKENHS